MGETNLDSLGLSGDLVVEGDIGKRLIDSVSGDGAIGTGSFGAPKTYRSKSDGVIKTIIEFDITGLGCKGDAADDVIGLVSTAPDAYIGQYVIADYGVVFKATLACIETPGEATATITGDIDIASATASNLGYDEAVGDITVINGGTLVIGQSFENLEHGMAGDDYIYIVEGDAAATTGVYNAGQYILTFYGHAVLD